MSLVPGPTCKALPDICASAARMACSDAICCSHVAAVAQREWVRMYAWLVRSHGNDALVYYCDLKG